MPKRLADLSSYTSIRLTDEQRERLEVLAKQNHRTVSGELRHMLALYLDAEEADGEAA